MKKINDVTFSLEMTDLKFRLGIIWCAIFKKRAKILSREFILCDEFIKKFNKTKK